MLSRRDACAWLRTALVLAFILPAWCDAAHAQALSRTWVSGVGDDNNPCSRVAPGKTFTGALAKTVAGGEIDTLDSGSFTPVTIGKSVTIDGGSTQALVVASGANTSGISVAAGATDTVVLRRLTIAGNGTSASLVNFSGGARLVLDRCTLFGGGTPSASTSVAPRPTS